MLTHEQMLHNARMKRRNAEPEVRVGNCCGCNQQAVLFKIPAIFRYRCAACFERETGYRHHLSQGI